MARSLVLDGESLVAPGEIRRAARRFAATNPSDLIVAKAELAVSLDLSIRQFRSGVEPRAIIERLSEALHQLRRRFHPEVWDVIVPIAQSHPVAHYLHQDPLTRWSFEKPRGYSGDARLLDFIYGRPEIEDDVASSSTLGRSIYAYTRNASSSVAVRERRDILARRVDEIASARPGSTEVLAIASGHLREGPLSHALGAGAIKRWVALDQDPMSVGTVARDFAGTSVEALNGSVKSLLAGRHALGMFDFVYAAGLYDYLPDAVAIKLTKKCVSMLKPGGTFLFANFSPATDVDGYMETFMNWALLLRSEHEMGLIASESAAGADLKVSVWPGTNRSVVYCEIERQP
ncbi:class I SAM-dependent methyltransferase [Rhizobium redzepovicii]|uniref:Class I SAM-dependent methyltransferase n=1 Tax=Rhizobium redzepovicii TaxID=2867518 RepID=A0AAW8NY49_9HYPH|nr:MULTISPECIES: class I SAM-dependent methyltransferase [Rhizobium]MDF0663400.1 class I SAM-dependent methyltransferase [Rhizobium sp. BC49]MDR9759837.1 class I SAM-dependent methyltransferase [Rhizobium redzepovicii]MDR9780645.1 class I SAM-dependent methyltransferase [Rhizobium redzepovicii]ULJ82315.1 class I SAM-dependent methyltransferase [Rhizobium sp. C104]